MAHTTDGAHRRRPIDDLIAACAEAAGVTLWRWHADLTAICDFAGIAYEAECEPARAGGVA